MEEKKLDLNAPLLSVRRISSTRTTSDGVNWKKISRSPPNRQHSLPLHASDWELGEVTKPVAVPFQWEHTPGRPKYHSGPLPRQPKEASNTPKLPPRRLSGVIKPISGEKYNDQNVFRTKTEVSPCIDYAMLLDSLIEDINKKDSYLESEGDAYSDVLDKLSSRESFSLNCSVSGLSGYDDADVKPSGTFSTDPQTQDFFMSRFLPAAKAAILETPQYISRRQPVVTEQPRQVNKVISGELRPLVERYGSNTISPYGKYTEDKESRDEDEYDDPSKRPLKACGLSPRVGVKNYLCLLNTVPGMKQRTQTPKSSAREVNRLARTAYSGPLTQPRTSHSGPLTRTLEKNSWNAVHRNQFQSGVRSQELHEVEKKLMGELKRFSYSADLCKTEESSPCRRSKSSGISPYRNERSQSPFRDGARFLGLPKEVDNGNPRKFSSSPRVCNDFQDASSHQMFKQGLGSVQPVVEKTLYIDSVSSAKIPVLNSVRTESERFKNSSAENFKTMVESRREETLTPKSSIQDKKCIYLLERGSKPKVQPVGNSDMNNENTTRPDDQRKLNVDSLQSSLPPPLPKSPSESWLWQTLPSISFRNPFSHSHIGKHFHPKKQNQETPVTSTKWETIVKTSNLENDHERIPHVPHHSKT